MTSPADASHTWLEDLDVQGCLEVLTPKHVGRFASTTVARWCGR